MLLADVAVPVPLARAFSYAVPAALTEAVLPGARVLCEFRRRSVVGVVLDVAEREPQIAPEKVKPIKAVLDTTPCVPEELLRFLRELAAYYLAPIGEVLRMALPAMERSIVRDLQQRGLLEQEARGKVGGRRVQVVQPTDELGSRQDVRGVAARVLMHLRATGDMPLARLQEIYPSARGAVRRLENLGLVHVEMKEAPTDRYFREQVPRDEPPKLRDAQERAVSTIVERLEQSRPEAFLLHGVTGSGKTEVYLWAIATCLRQGSGALVLVPEIALTPQLVARFRARFGDGLAVLHSGLSERSRHDMWRSLREDRVRVAIGARSALFAPVPRLGLVVVDEEHDHSFKQEEGVRYHARDMALLRASRAGAVCVLGSATPSLESEALVRTGKLARLDLPERAMASATLPRVELVDLRRTGPGPARNPLLSLPLHRAIEQALAASEQSILFLNRRGFAPSVLCDACGNVASCPHCSVSLTHHRTGGSTLRCHYCDYDVPMWSACAECGADSLTLAGLGTERLEEVLKESFPVARIARLDRDVAPGERSEAVIEKMRKKRADILVGTQLVTKGHDLPDVTVVGVVNADAALSLPDFRAGERTFQILVQVAGRAGRSERPGRVLVQTRLPDHPVLRFALTHDVQGYIDYELGNRREVGYPPYARLALLRLDAADEARVRDEATRLARLARRTAPVGEGMVEVLGPSPAPIERIRGRYRYRIMLRCRDRGPLRSVARILNEARQQVDRRVRTSLDIDPIHML